MLKVRYSQVAALTIEATQCQWPRRMSHVDQTPSKRACTPTCAS